jgi:hypothetical protein
VLMDEPEEAHVSIVGYGGERGGRKGRGGGSGVPGHPFSAKGWGIPLFSAGEREIFAM